MSGPDRIWAWPWEVNPRVGQWSAEREIVGEGHEYIRRDPAVLAALPEVQALIAGAFDAAAKLALPGERGSQVDPTEFAAGCRHNGLRLNAAIRALIPADAIAARDAMIAEAVAKEREACAQMFGPIVAAAIRKRGEGQP